MSAQVFYVGPNAQKHRPTAEAADNHGFDDERGDYQWALHDHIAFRYEILGVLGKGSFGVVTKCFDWKSNQLVALKIIRNKKRFHHQVFVLQGARARAEVEARRCSSPRVCRVD